jgi:hypothetical protein
VERLRRFAERENMDPEEYKEVASIEKLKELYPPAVESPAGNLSVVSSTEEQKNA